jgi:hypothetical protein
MRHEQTGRGDKHKRAKRQIDESVGESHEKITWGKALKIETGWAEKRLLDAAGPMI